MERSVKKLLSSIIVMVFAGNIMMMIPTGLVRRMYEVLFKYGKWDPRHLQFIWNADRESVFWFFVFVLMAVLVVINLIRMISALISLVRGSGQAGRTAAGEKETEQVSRPYQTERRRAAMQKQQAALRKQRAATQKQRSAEQAQKNLQAQNRTARRGKGYGTDTELSHTFKTGKARYMEQLDNFLKDGVVTRPEYEELKRKYEQMDL